MLRKLLVLFSALTLFLAGCSSDAEGGADPAPPTESHSDSLDALSAMGGVEIVDYLDQMDRADRPTTLIASVRTDTVELADTVSGEQVSVDLPDDMFYLSFAPYVTSTHDCFYHSLTTCTGELFNETVDVTIVTEDGEVLVDKELTLFDNGFVGVWLPADITATLTVTYDGKTGTTQIGTGENDPTCLTTLQLT